MRADTLLFHERRRACGSRLPVGAWQKPTEGLPVTTARCASSANGGPRQSGRLFERDAKAAPQGRCRYIKPIAASTKHDPQYHRLRASSCILDTAAFHVGDFFGELRLHVIERIDRKIM